MQIWKIKRQVELTLVCSNRIQYTNHFKDCGAENAIYLPKDMKKTDADTKIWYLTLRQIYI